jgi:excisionase family DNA binding protein
MMHEDETYKLSDYVESKQAAKMLGISPSRLYDYLIQGRLKSKRVGRSYLVLVEDIKRYKPVSTGRARVKPLPWRTYKGGVKVLGIEIQVQVRAGQQQRLAELIQTIKDLNLHSFPGTLSRYILQDDAQPDNVEILLIWKSTDLPDEETRQAYLAAFQTELEDVFDWSTAKTKTRTALIYT